MRAIIWELSEVRVIDEPPSNAPSIEQPGPTLSRPIELTKSLIDDSKSRLVPFASGQIEVAPSIQPLQDSAIPTLHAFRPRRPAASPVFVDTLKPGLSPGSTEVWLPTYQPFAHLPANKTQHLSPVPAQASLPKTLRMDAWLIMRGQNRGSNLLPEGTLGGSQLGFRARFPVVQNHDKRGLSATLSFASPLFTQEGKQAALGVSSRPFAHLPVEFIVEHRFPLGNGGEPKLVALAAGGVDDVRLAKNWTMSSYAQLGIAGMKQGELFADGNAIVRRSLSDEGRRRIMVGAGIWGAAQPRLARIDVGPIIELRQNLGPMPVSLGLQWRVRVAGNAGPGSGPSLTLATGF